MVAYRCPGIMAMKERNRAHMLREHRQTLLFRELDLTIELLYLLLNDTMKFLIPQVLVGAVENHQEPAFVFD
jgi:hypothetical protein